MKKPILKIMLCIGIAISIVLFGACSDNLSPNAVITLASTSANVGESINFDGTASTDSDGSIESYDWDFGDSSDPETTATTTHSYSAAGTYTIKLTVTDDAGDSDTAEAEMVIIDDNDTNTAPVAKLTASSSSVKAGVSVSFDGSESSDSDGSISSYSWDFGDGATAIGSSSASHVYSEVGNYVVELTVTDNEGDTDTASLTITVVSNSLPTASFTVDPSSGELGTAVSFDASGSSDSDGSIASYSWDFGDYTSGSGVLATHTYSSAGNYYVVLTVTDDDGAADTTDLQITVNDPDNNAPTADAGEDQSIDLDNDSTTIALDGSGSSDTEDGSISTYAWSFYSLPENSSLSDSDISGAATDTASFDLSSETGTTDSDGNYVYVLRLIVTDSENAVGTDFVTITVTGTGSVAVDFN